VSDAVATVPLALEDAVPVLLSGCGCVMLARHARDLVAAAWLPALAGAAAVTAGGAAKVGWKLTLAVTGRDVPVVADLLFGFLAVGFVLLAWALLSAYRGRLLRAWPAAAAVGAGLAGAGLARSTGPLLAVAVVAATATGVVAVLLARRCHDTTAMVLLALQVVAAYALVPFSLPPQTVAKQWGEQAINTVGQLAFVWGAARLAGVTAFRLRPSRPVEGGAVA
jgi:hypothetical protein